MVWQIPLLNGPQRAHCRLLAFHVIFEVQPRGQYTAPASAETRLNVGIRESGASIKDELGSIGHERRVCVD